MQGVKVKVLVAAVMAGFCSFLAEAGTTYYVDCTKADDTGDGRSAATAKKYINSAIDLCAKRGDTVVVLPGDYADDPPREDAYDHTATRVLIADKSVHLKSRDGKAKTRIVGAYAAWTDQHTYCGDGAVRCLAVTGDGAADTVVEGFTLARGATKLKGMAGGCYFYLTKPNAYLLDCDVVDCYGDEYCAAVCYGTAVRCLFSRNGSNWKGPSVIGSGNYVNCVFTGGSAYYGFAQNVCLYNCTVACNEVNALYPYCGNELARFEIYNTLAVRNRIQLSGGGKRPATCACNSLSPGSGDAFALVQDSVTNVLPTTWQVMSPMSGDFRLTRRSAAINAGRAEWLAEKLGALKAPASVDFYRDFAGNAIPKFGTIHAGAVQAVAKVAYDCTMDELFELARRAAGDPAARNLPDSALWRAVARRFDGRRTAVGVRAYPALDPNRTYEIDLDGKTAVPTFRPESPDVLLVARAGADGSRSVAVCNRFSGALVDAQIVLDRAFAHAEFVNCRGRLDGSRVVLDEVPACGFAAFTVFPASVRPLPTRGLCAHRGDRKCYPENSVLSFRSAVAKGAAMVEFDVDRCRTGELVVMHDPAVDRTSDGHGKVRELSFDEIRRLDIGVKKGPQFKGTRIPTFDEAIDSFPYDGVWIKVHCKGYVTDEVARKLKAKGRLHQAFVGADDDAGIRAARAAVPEVMTCLMKCPWTEWTAKQRTDFFAKAVGEGYDFATPVVGSFTRDDTDPFHAYGGKLNYFWLTDPKLLPGVFTMGIDFPLVDELDRMLETYRRWEADGCPPGGFRVDLDWYGDSLSGNDWESLRIDR